MVKIKVKNLDESFERYGRVIEPFNEAPVEQGKGRDFYILSESKSSGWRIGYLIQTSKEVNYLEKHPESKETFEPIEGGTIILLSLGDKIDAYLLDKPIIINEGVWHALIALSEKVKIKISENLEVKKITKPIKPPTLIIPTSFKEL
jgi:ureidoglycolate hydrolase